MKTIFTTLSLLLISVFGKSQVNYGLQSIPYAPEPFNIGATTSLTADDMFSSILPIGFTFTFYGNNFDFMVISSNGSVSFNTSNANTFAPFSIPGVIIPTTTPALLNSILAPYHDMNIAGNPNGIRTNISGAAPNRKLAISFENVDMFGCSGMTQTSQIILYESTNIIDIYLELKPICTAWNNGAALLGIQDATGLLGVCPPGRNGNTQWTTTSEAWRFIPGSLGLNENEKQQSQINIYPNPMKESTTISFPNTTNEAMLSICNLVGETVFVDEMQGDSYFLKQNLLPKGMYIVRVQTKNGRTANSKLVVE